MIAEYERAKIMERSRRGKRHAAAEGRVSVLSGAPYGYLYVGRHEGGGEAYYEIVLEEARVVRQLFEWVGKDRVSISEVCRRLERARIRTRTGKNVWDRATVWGILRNPAYKDEQPSVRHGQPRASLNFDPNEDNPNNEAHLFNRCGSSRRVDEIRFRQLWMKTCFPRSVSSWRKTGNETVSGLVAPVTCYKVCLCVNGVAIHIMENR